MKRLLSSIVIIGLILFTFFIITAHPLRSTNSPQAVAGHLNLEDWSFAEQGTLKLSGDWEIYDGQLLTPEHFRAIDSEQAEGAGVGSQAVEQATSNAAKQASGQAVSQAVGQVAEQASGQAAGQATGQAAAQAVDRAPQLSGYFDPTAARSIKHMFGGKPQVNDPIRNSDSTNAASNTDNTNNTGNTDTPSDASPIFSELGARTFRLLITFSEPPEKALAMKLGNISNSSRLYVNGQKIGENGIVALDKQQYKADAKGYDAYFEADGRELEIILQVANHSNFGYSFLYNMWLGTANAISLQTAFGIAIELCGAAICFIIFLYHLYIAVYTRAKRYLYFSLLFLVMSLIFLVSGEMLILRFAEDIPYELQVKLRGFCRIALGMLFQLYLFHEIKDLLKMRVHQVLITIYALMLVSILAMNLDGYARTIDLFYLTLMLLLFYKFWRVIYVWRTQRFQFSLNSVFVYVIIILCWMTSYINNTLYNLGVVHNKAIGSIGISLFIILSQMLLAFRYIRNVHHVRDLELAKEEFFVNSAYYLRAPLDSILSITSQILGVRQQVEQHEHEAHREHQAPKEHQQQQVLSTTENKYDANIAMIKQLATRMIRHVSDIKDLTLLKYDQLKLSFDSILLHAVLEQAIDEVTILHNEYVQPLRVKLNMANRLMVLGDEERVRQVLYTLIRQAANHPKVSVISITAKAEKNKIVLHIHNDGEVMLVDKQERLFRPDYIDDTNIGYNLFMIRELVHAMGGTLEFAWSREREGTCIELCLTGYEIKARHELNEQLIELRTEQLMPSWSELGQHKEQQQTILIVEDQYYNIQTLLGMLQDEAFNLIYAYSGEEALHMLRSYEVDLVLMDIGLQDLSGIAVCREIRSSYSLIELPIILMSVSMSAEELEQGFSAGANDYIRKPFVQQEIIARVKSQLAISSSMELAMQNELAFLQTQIEPHFIYNVINSVISLCYSDPMKAAQVLTDFSQYLRLVFDIEATLHEVPLERELELIGTYVNIERIRFGEKYKLVLDVPQHLRSIKIPSFCIQPLVENAIKHGLYYKLEGGTIHVQVSCHEERLVIVVSDDGIGMSEEQLQKLLAGEASKGIGFGNVKKRISHMPEGTFHVLSQQGIGTSVTISFSKPKHCFQ